LFDSRRIPQDDDVSFMGFLQTKQIPLLLVVTKVDKVNQSGKALIQKNMQPFSNVIPNLNYLLVSVKNKDSIVVLKAKISQMI
jgi:GTP-binding protein EngB required for normal cell division